MQASATKFCNSCAIGCKMRVLELLIFFQQLGGFVLLLTGVFVYNRVFEVPGFKYPQP